MISEKDIIHIAKLAKLKFLPDEIKEFAHQFSKIIAYFNQLQEVNTENVEPTAHVVEITNIHRKDEFDQKRLLKIEEIKKLAPKFRDNQIEVPRVVG